MPTMYSARLVVLGTTTASLLGLSSCVSDPAVEDTVASKPGLIQPDGSSGSPLSAAAACEKLKVARSQAADKLGCDAPADECPRYLYLAGSIPCDEYTEGSVNACVAAIGTYETCSDFSAKPCAVTAIGSSCKNPVPPDAGASKRDGATVKPKDGGIPRPKGDASKD